MPLVSIKELPLQVEQDPFNDTITIEGQRYSRELFRMNSYAPLGTWLRIQARDITITVFEVSAGTPMAKQFDQLSEAPRGVKIDARCDSDIDHLLPPSGA